MQVRDACDEVIRGGRAYPEDFTVRVITALDDMPVAAAIHVRPAGARYGLSFFQAASCAVYHASLLEYVGDAGFTALLVYYACCSALLMYCSCCLVTH